MEHKDFDKYGFYFWNQHKGVFGVKLEIPVATQRTPVPLGVSVMPAGWHDLEIARRRDGVFARMLPGERALGDPGYLGQADKIYAPPHRGMNSFDKDVDKAELTLQRRVELANGHVKQFKCLGTTYRKGAVRAFRDLETISIAVVKLVYLDIVLNPEHYGPLHIGGPIPDLVSPKAVLHVVGAGARARLLKRRRNFSQVMLVKRKNLLKRARF